jgi:dihydroflavonol-4-reductase
MRGKVLVTGGTGFLGGRLVRALCERGERVRVLAQPGASLRTLNGLDVEISEGDITIEHTVYRALAGCDRLFHCAAVFAIWARDPRTIMDGAVLGTRTVLSAAKGRGIERTVYTSTAYTIGATDEPRALDETTPWIEPVGPVYAIAKRRAEEVALEFAAGGLHVVTVNPASIFGPGDYKPTPTGSIVLEALRAVVVPGLGTMLPRLPGGMNVVDVDDVVSGHIAAMERGRSGERYILASANITMAETVATIASLAGLPPPVLPVTRAAVLATGALLSTIASVTGDAPIVSLDAVRGSFGRFYYVSNEKARRELAFEPRPPRAALARAVHFFASHESFLTPAQRGRLRLDPATASVT